MHSSGPLGDYGEALAAVILNAGMKHEILTQHTPGARRQGIDIESLSPSGQVVVTEVKTTNARKHQRPKMTKNVADIQMEPSWMSKNLAADGQTEAFPDQVGEAPDQVGRQVIQIDVPSGVATVHEVSDAGKVGPAQEMWNTADFKSDE